jgi:acyl-CoA thioesterase
MGFELDRALELTATGASGEAAGAAEAGEPGEYAATLDAGWVVGGGVNGGYLMALLASAARAVVPEKPDALAISAHFTSASTAGPATVVTRLLREGRGVSTVGVDLAQDGALRIAALATMGVLPSGDEGRSTATPPEMPPPEACVVMPDEVRAELPLTQRFEMRFDPATAGFLRGEPTGEAHLQSWFRLADGREPDALSLLVALDAMPPVTMAQGRFGWAPTLELTCMLRATPAPGWLRLTHRARTFSGGMFEEDCEVWDSRGQLVAQSRQLAREPRD